MSARDLSPGEGCVVMKKEAVIPTKLVLAKVASKNPALF
jgi:hypothetical protein